MRPWLSSIHAELDNHSCHLLAVTDSYRKWVPDLSAMNSVSPLPWLQSQGCPEKKERHTQYPFRISMNHLGRWNSMSAPETTPEDPMSMLRSWRFLFLLDSPQGLRRRSRRPWPEARKKRPGTPHPLSSTKPDVLLLARSGYTRVAHSSCIPCNRRHHVESCAFCFPEADRGVHVVCHRGAAVCSGGGSGTGVFVPTGNMTVARYRQTATLLRPGRSHRRRMRRDQRARERGVIRPSSRNFHPHRQHGSARWTHTATLLPNGRCSSPAGDDSIDGTNVLASAELYDPVAGTFTRPHPGRGQVFPHGGVAGQRRCAHHRRHMTASRIGCERGAIQLVAGNSPSQAP